MESFETIQQRLAQRESRFVDCGGFRLHYKQYGSGKAPYVILLHGSFLSMRSWRHITGPLSAVATLIAIDRPSFGLTSRPIPSKQHPVSYSPEAQSDLLVAFMQQLSIDEAMLMGNSTGGTIALLTAIRHPQRVAGLVLVDAMVYSAYAASDVPAAMKPFMKAASPFFALVMRGMISAFFPRAMRSFWHDPDRLPPEVLDGYRRDLMVGPWARSFWEIFVQTHHLHLEERVGSLHLPVLVVTGEHDRTVRVEESRRLAREVQGARLLVVPDSAHLPHEEQPERFLEGVLPFLADAGHAG